MRNLAKVALVIAGIWIGYKVGNQRGITTFRNNWNIYADLRGRSRNGVLEGELVGALVGGIVGFLLSLSIGAGPPREPTAAGPKKPLDDNDPV